MIHTLSALLVVVIIFSTSTALAAPISQTQVFDLSERNYEEVAPIFVREEDWFTTRATIDPLPLVRRSERDLIAAALKRCGGNHTKAAHELGISRETLVRKIKQYGL